MTVLKQRSASVRETEPARTWWRTRETGSAYGRPSRLEDHVASVSVPRCPNSLVGLVHPSEPNYLFRPLSFGIQALCSFDHSRHGAMQNTVILIAGREHCSWGAKIRLQNPRLHPIR